MPNAKSLGGLSVEFSLALNNRTGKFFAAADMIACNRASIAAVRYWRLAPPEVPHGAIAKLLGRLAKIEIDLRHSSRWLDAVLPKMRPSSGVIFTDPLQTLTYYLEKRDTVVVHDLGPLTNPGFYAPKVGELYALAYARIQEARCRLIFVSEAARDAYAMIIGLDGCVSRIIYNPVRQASFAGDAFQPNGVRRPFLLTVGAVGDRKNQLGALQGFAMSGLAEAGYQYVICGGPEPGYAAVRAKAGSVDGSLLLGYASEPELRWLYANAEGFVLPSFLEGFGMPAAEALLNGLLPVLSTDAALMEVAGPQAIYVDPTAPTSIAEGLKALAAMPLAHRAERVRQALPSLDRFSEAAVRASWRTFFEEAART